MINLRKIVLHSTLIIAIFIGNSSCMNNKPEDTKDIAKEHNDAKFEKESSETDAQFLVNAAEINMEEINLGKLAQENGKMNHVKELGKMMEDAHSKSTYELTNLAKTKNITIPKSPTDKAMKAYKTLSNKSGINFDKSYSEMMVNGHKDAIAIFEKASTDCTDPEIKAWAFSTLPALRKHLDHAMLCQKEYDKM